MAPEITTGQIRAIHTACSRQGIDDETYRALLSAEFGALSCKDLDRGQASLLLDRLNGRRKRHPVRILTRPRPKDRPAPPEPLPPGIARMASPAQRRLIEELRSEIEWREGPAGYEIWLRRNLGIDRVLTTTDAARAIEGLKAMARRERAS